MYTKDFAEITAQIVVAALNNGASSNPEDIANLYQTVHDKVLELADSDTQSRDPNRRNQSYSEADWQ